MGGDDLGDALVRFESLRERARGLVAVLAERERGIERDRGASVDQAVVASLEADAARLARELVRRRGAHCRARRPPRRARAGRGGPGAGPAGLHPRVGRRRGHPHRCRRRGARRAGRRARGGGAQRHRGPPPAERIATSTPASARLAAEAERLEAEVAEAAPTAAAAGTARCRPAPRPPGSRAAAATELEEADEARRIADASAPLLDGPRRGAGAGARPGPGQGRGRAPGRGRRHRRHACSTWCRSTDGGRPRSRRRWPTPSPRWWSSRSMPAAGACRAAFRRRHRCRLGAGRGASRDPSAPRAVSLRGHVRGIRPGVDELLDVLVGSTEVAVDWTEAVDVALADPGVVVVTRGRPLRPSGWRVGAAGAGATGAALTEAEANAEAGRRRSRLARRLATPLGLARPRGQPAPPSGCQPSRRPQRRSAQGQRTDALTRTQRDHTDAVAEAETLRAQAVELEDRARRDADRQAELEARLPTPGGRGGRPRRAGPGDGRGPRPPRGALDGGGQAAQRPWVRAAGLDERRQFLKARAAELDERLSRHVGERQQAEGRRVELDRRAVATARFGPSWPPGWRWSRASWPGCASVVAAVRSHA
jgi:chromosome segregation protein